MPSEGMLPLEPGKNPAMRDTGNIRYDTIVENMRQDQIHYLEQMMDFRYKVQSLANTEKHSHLKDIDVEKLSDLDCAFFQDFEKGRLTKTQIQNQLHILRRPGGQENSVHSRKLFNYMLIEVLKKNHRPKSKQINMKFS